MKFIIQLSVVLTLFFSFAVHANPGAKRSLEEVVVRFFGEKKGSELIAKARATANGDAILKENLRQLLKSLDEKASSRAAKSSVRSLEMADEGLEAKPMAASKGVGQSDDLVEMLESGAFAKLDDSLSSSQRQWLQNSERLSVMEMGLQVALPTSRVRPARGLEQITGKKASSATWELAKYTFRNWLSKIVFVRRYVKEVPNNRVVLEHLRLLNTRAGRLNPGRIAELDAKTFAVTVNRNYHGWRKMNEKTADITKRFSEGEIGVTRQEVMAQRNAAAEELNLPKLITEREAEILYRLDELRRIGGTEKYLGAIEKKGEEIVNMREILDGRLTLEASGRVQELKDVIRDLRLRKNQIESKRNATAKQLGAADEVDAQIAKLAAEIQASDEAVRAVYDDLGSFDRVGLERQLKDKIDLLESGSVSGKDAVKLAEEVQTLREQVLWHNDALKKMNSEYQFEAYLFVQHYEVCRSYLHLDQGKVFIFNETGASLSVPRVNADYSNGIFMPSPTLYGKWERIYEKAMDSEAVVHLVEGELKAAIDFASRKGEKYYKDIQKLLSDTPTVANTTVFGRYWNKFVGLFKKAKADGDKTLLEQLKKIRKSVIQRTTEKLIMAGVPTAVVTLVVKWLNQEEPADSEALKDQIDTKADEAQKKADEEEK